MELGTCDNRGEGVAKKCWIVNKLLEFHVKQNAGVIKSYLEMISSQCWGGGGGESSEI